MRKKSDLRGLCIKYLCLYDTHPYIDTLLVLIIPKLEELFSYTSSLITNICIQLTHCVLNGNIIIMVNNNIGDATCWIIIMLLKESMSLGEYFISGIQRGVIFVVELLKHNEVLKGLRLSYTTVSVMRHVQQLACNLKKFTNLLQISICAIDLKVFFDFLIRNANGVYE